MTPSGGLTAHLEGFEAEFMDKPSPTLHERTHQGERSRGGVVDRSDILVKTTFQPLRKIDQQRTKDTSLSR